MARAISATTASTYDRSAAPPSPCGVPTAMNTASLCSTASPRCVVNTTLPPRCFANSSGRCFSKMGTPPSQRCFTRASSLSTQTTWWPMSAKQTAATSPTYPEPMTQIDTGFDMRWRVPFRAILWAGWWCGAIPFRLYTAKSAIQGWSQPLAATSTFYIAAHRWSMRPRFQAHLPNHRVAHKGMLAVPSNPS